MSNKIFVANFPFSLTQEALGDLFSLHGEVVSAKVATDRESGRSRGFGFVEMSSAEEATLAIEKLNGHDIEGRPLAVRIAEDRQGGGGRGGPRRGPGGGGGRFGDRDREGGRAHGNGGRFGDRDGGRGPRY